MKIFRCDKCDGLVFFENTQCVQCDSRLAFLPERDRIATLTLVGAGNWRTGDEEATPSAETRRLCVN